MVPDLELIARSTVRFLCPRNPTPRCARSPLTGSCQSLIESGGLRIAGQPGRVGVLAMMIASYQIVT